MVSTGDYIDDTQIDTLVGKINNEEDDRLDNNDYLSVNRGDEITFSNWDGWFEANVLINNAHCYCEAHGPIVTHNGGSEITLRACGCDTVCSCESVSVGGCGSDCVEADVTWEGSSNDEVKASYYNNLYNDIDEMDSQCDCDGYACSCETNCGNNCSCNSECGCDSDCVCVGNCDCQTHPECTCDNDCGNDCGCNTQCACESDCTCVGNCDCQSNPNCYCDSDCTCNTDCSCQSQGCGCNTFFCSFMCNDTVCDCQSQGCGCNEVCTCQTNCDCDSNVCDCDVDCGNNCLCNSECGCDDDCTCFGYCDCDANVCTCDADCGNNCLCNSEACQCDDDCTCFGNCDCDEVCNCEYGG